MSGLAGILSFDFQTYEPTGVLEAMSEALAVCGPDDAHKVRHGGVAMAFRALNVTAESRLVRQPILTDDGLLLCWDGRLDNRKSLQQRFGLRGDANQPDAEIVLATYRHSREKTFEEFPAQLIGDFALALWDAPKLRLVLARDPFAGRPLFFAEGRDRILWASTIRALFVTREVAPEVDDDWVEAYLINAEGANRSPFKAVRVAAPGEAVIFTPERIRRRRFWQPDVGRSIRFRRDGDYEEAFRELFFDAVRCRLRAPGPVFAELSGGVDSSSIVCVADQMIERGEVEASELYTQSWVYDRASEADERPFMKVIEEHTGRQAFHLLEDDYPLLSGFQDVGPQVVPSECHIWPLGRRRAIEMLREKGSRVLLSGFAGDHLLWSQMAAPSHLADHVVRLRPWALMRDLGRWHREAGYAYPALFWQGVLKPLWCAARGSGSQELEFAFTWLSDRLRSRRAEFTAQSLERGTGFVLPSRRMRIETLRWGVNGRSWLIDDIEESIDSRYPFLHRPLVEFCLAIPFEQHARPDEMRSLHRRALKGILPEAIRTRECKRGPSEAILRGFRREWPVIKAMFADPDAQIYQRGYVQREPFLEELQRISCGIYGDHAILIRTLQVEVWLRSLKGLLRRR